MSELTAFFTEDLGGVLILGAALGLLVDWWINHRERKWRQELLRQFEEDR